MKRVIQILLIMNMLLMMHTISYAKSKIDVPDIIKVKLGNGKIVEMKLDEYLYGVVSAEMGTSYQTKGKTKQVGIEALKAQAVASRSYAVNNIQHSKNNEYDISVSSAGQVYKSGTVADIVKKAVDATSGQVVTYKGGLVSTNFFTASGGHTESSENVWYAKLPYAQGVEDPYEPYIEGKSEWEARIPYSKYGEIKILERSSNDRVTKLQVGSKVYEKSDIRSKLGNSLLKSTWFELSYDEDTEEYVFKGKGYGHGVGMSQYGAMGMAEAGFDYEEIIKWYYTGVEITPANVEYIEIEEEDGEKVTDDIKTEAVVKENDNKIEKEDNSIKKEEKDYSNTKQVVVEKEKGQLLKRLISTIESWR